MFIICLYIFIHIIKKINNNVPIFIAPVLNLSEILKKDILDLEKGYPGKANIFHTPKGLFYETFDNNEKKIETNLLSK